MTTPPPIFSPSGREAHALDIHVPSNKVQKLLPPFPTRVEVFLVHLFSKTKSFPAIHILFGSVVVGAFQIIFHVKIHVNDFFLFFKNHF